MRFSFISLIFLLNTSLFPQQSTLSKGVNYLSEFIASDYFVELKENNSDLALVDSVYKRALVFTKKNFGEALLDLTFATVPYKEVPIEIPIIKTIINYPLISHNDSVFHLKNRNLPKDLFFDTPQNDFGDKDKLAHFFGSAYVSYYSNIFDLGRLIGYFVEVFEEDFKVQSAIDERDLIVDDLGILFGKVLKNNKQILPSHIMILHSLIQFNFHFP